MEAILQNKFRSFLTSLGIIFGVGSVIAMLAIGKGAQEEILEKMKLLGANNIIIKPKIETKKEKKDNEEEGKKENVKFSPGLTISDAMAIKNVIPVVESSSPEINLDLLSIARSIKIKTKVVGVDADYFASNQFDLNEGSIFNMEQINSALPVCVIGAGIKKKFFPDINSTNEFIKCGSIWLKVIGSLQEKKINKDNIKNLGIRDYNMDIYVPINTALLRFRNRSLITKQSFSQNYQSDDDAQKAKDDDNNTNQLDKITVRVSDTKYAKMTSAIIKSMLARRHNYVNDYEIVVPEELLEQEQRTKSIFNIVLGSIASISLVVGGIGIMNIMLASVMERIKEIGARLAVGAKKRDVILQFLCEAVSISIVGGFLGIALGIGLSYAIELFAGIKTIISFYSIILSFAVSVSVGIIFGIMPARKAANQDPIESLRYE